MKNREKYGEKLKKNIFSGKLCNFISDNILAKHDIRCSQFDCTKCAALFALWLDEEYEGLAVDWSKVPVDAFILVKDSKGHSWLKRHFAKFEDGEVYAWTNGRSSKTCDTEDCKSWKYAEIVEE